MKTKKCNCEGCKHTPHLTTLAAKATPAEKKALDWIYADMENTSVEAALEAERYERKIEKLLSENRDLHRIIEQDNIERKRRR